MNTKCYMFSKSHMDKMKFMAQKIGSGYDSKSVLVNGTFKPFTEIVNKPGDSKWSDSILVVQGDPTKMKVITKHLIP